jgi:hypothetical protein
MNIHTIKELARLALILVFIAVPVFVIGFLFFDKIRYYHDKI